MNEEDFLYKMEALFREAGKAHHKAFTNTDGTDPEWPLWYADYLPDKLGRLLNANFTKSELIYLNCIGRQGNVSDGTRCRLAQLLR